MLPTSTIVMSKTLTGNLKQLLTFCQQVGGMQTLLTIIKNYDTE